MWYHTASMQGRRPYNEDEVDILVNLDGSTKGAKPVSFFAVYDGHGGNAISKYLRANLQRYFVDEMVDKDPAKSKRYDKYVHKVYDTVQNKLVHYELPSKTTGSTALVTIAYRTGDRTFLKVINLGDCRAVVCNRYNIAVPLTKDHKPTSFEEFQRIVAMGGKVTHERNDDPRINGMAVSRAFGDLDARPHVTNTPDIYDYDADRCRFIIMACDGVWDVLSNQDAVDFVLAELDALKGAHKENLTSPKAKKNVAAKLISHAIDKGTMDNVTAIVIFLE